MRKPLPTLTLALALVALTIASGAPRASAADIQSQVTPQVIEHAQQTLWSLQPIARPTPPQVKQQAWVLSPIDQFVLAKLEARGIAPSRLADRRKLIRRAYFDLIGLPPTYEQVEAFANDSAPIKEAFTKVVDQLLASPQFGERWGRHWLDIARYADNKGYIGVGQEMRYPFSYTYRDYVVRAFNDNKPYDTFIIEQLAADKLDANGQLVEKRDLAAMGFLTVGRRFINSVPEIIDDRIDVTTRGLMGLTVTCARCHDHKYDAVTMADYYGLYGVFASSMEPDDLPLVGDPKEGKAYDDFQAQMAQKQKAVDDYTKSLVDKIGDELRSRVGDYLEYLANTLPVHTQGNIPFTGRRGELRRRAVDAWRDYLAARYGGADDPVFAVWNRLATTPRDKLADETIRVLDELAARADDKAVNPRVIDALRKNPPKTMADVARVYGALLEGVYTQHHHNPAPDAVDEQLRQVLYADGAPPAMSPQDVERFKNRAERDKLRNLENDIEKLKVSSPGAPPRAMVMIDRDRPSEARIHIRGDVNRPGERVDRRFLRVLAPVDGGKPFADGSGRLELARAVANKDNPLTARVWVSRVWQHLFGVGLVRTADDFGVRSDLPPELDLLDYLSSNFIDGGWSNKALIKSIMLSATYMQTSDDRNDASAIDPENTLWWQQNRRRIDFEPLRDSLLFVAGRLDATMGGRPVDITNAGVTRRGIYAFIDRQNIPDLLSSFDVASPDACTPARPTTTVPQQALFMMNSPFLEQQAKALVVRAGTPQGDGAKGRITAIYRLALSRDPSDAEVKLAEAYVGADAQPKIDRWWAFAQALLLSNEFSFVD